MLLLLAASAVRLLSGNGEDSRFTLISGVAVVFGALGGPAYLLPLLAGELPAMMQCNNSNTRERHPRLARRTMHTIRRYTMQRYTLMKMPFALAGFSLLVRSVSSGPPATNDAMKRFSHNHDAPKARNNANDTLTQYAAIHTRENAFAVASARRSCRS